MGNYAAKWEGYAASTRMNQQLWIVYYLAINKLISEYYYYSERASYKEFFPLLWGYLFSSLGYAKVWSGNPS